MACGPRRTFWSMVLAMAAALALAGAGCRSCAEDGGAPAEAAPDAKAGGLRVARGIKEGAWTELQIATPGDRPDRADFHHWRDDSSFVSLEAITLMHEAFARALPGFDLFLPRLFAAEALVKLGAELEAFALRASGEISATAREVAQLARGAAAKGQGLWVLGP